MAQLASPAVDFGLHVEEAERQGPLDIVKKESHPILVRKKRAWIWNSLYVEEEKPAPIPYKFGQVGYLRHITKTICVINLGGYCAFTDHQKESDGRH